jgi:hypothetical protein
MIIWRESKETAKKIREALVDTNQCEKSHPIMESAELVRTLRDKLTSELSAANEYSHLNECLNATLNTMNSAGLHGTPAFQTVVAIINRITEVLQDEENHAGVILQCIQTIDPEIMENGVKGFRGKESGDGGGTFNPSGSDRL